MASVNSGKYRGRVRSGCLTCKARHVKCDEEKPICGRCTKGGYRCDGYGNNTPALRLGNKESWEVAQPSSSFLSSIHDEVTTSLRAQKFPNSSRQHMESSAPQNLPQRQTTSSQEKYEKFESEGNQAMTSYNEHATPPTRRLVVQPSAGPKFKNMIEYQYFVVFWESAVIQLSGYHESSLWNCVIPQACNEEQWAMNAVIAIGALHRYAQSERNHRTADGERKGRRHYIFALIRYGQALEQFNKKAKDEYQSESYPRLTLIFPILTTYFETYIGNSENAITQAQAGVALLFKWAKDKEPADDLADEWSHVRRVASRSPYLHQDLLSAFQRLDHQILLCKGFQPGRQLPRAFPSIDYPFTSLDEACTFWDQVVRRVLYIHSLKDVREQHSPQGYNDDNAQNGNVHTESHNFNIATQQFSRSFMPIFESSRGRPGTKEYLLANLVMIRFLACRFVFWRDPSYSELYSDFFLRDYMTVIRLAGELIYDSKTTQRKAIFSSDITLGISIFSLSRLCRVHTVRKQALDLLSQFPQREGWFDAHVATKILTWIINEEEGGMVDGFIPDSARLRLVKHDSVPEKQAVDLHCSKLAWQDGRQVRKMIPPVTIIL